MSFARFPFNQKYTLFLLGVCYMLCWVFVFSISYSCLQFFSFSFSLFEFLINFIGLSVVFFSVDFINSTWVLTLHWSQSIFLLFLMVSLLLSSSISLSLFLFRFFEYWRINYSIADEKICKFWLIYWKSISMWTSINSLANRLSNFLFK